MHERDWPSCKVFFWLGNQYAKCEKQAAPKIQDMLRKMSVSGVSWTTSEFSASTPTSGRLQPRTRGNGAERQNKGRNIS